jgi:DNA-binding transcriptional MerR regulator
MEANFILTDGDPSSDFNDVWIEAWQNTDNYRIFSLSTDSHLFDIVEPRHICAGGLTIDDVQRRIAQLSQELHLDERLNTTKEVVGKTLGAGQKKVAGVLANVWADIEVMREAQRKRREEEAEKEKAERKWNRNGMSSPPATGTNAAKNAKSPNLNETAAQVGAKAGAYFSSWGTWASEKRKTGWGRGSPSGSRASEEVKEPPQYLKNYSPTDYSSGDYASFSHSPKPSQDSTLSNTGLMGRRDSFEETMFDRTSGSYAGSQVTSPIKGAPQSRPGTSDRPGTAGTVDTTATDSSLLGKTKAQPVIEEKREEEERRDSPYAAKEEEVDEEKERMEQAAQAVEVAMPADEWRDVEGVKGLKGLNIDGVKGEEGDLKDVPL